MRLTLFEDNVMKKRRRKKKTSFFVMLREGGGQQFLGRMIFWCQAIVGARSAKPFVVVFKIPH